ncbi:MAG: UDP-N-acetylmuramoyl-L-alanine--D-glutamate ligase [Planctomycetes bacterium]|nr:UDP-N-acetylmuramoyl-L-alanine--D-glutamate ligase [Planctomycetota bacterium]
MSPTNFSGKNVVVMGLGRFGGGVGVSRWLAEQNAKVIVTDLANESDLASSIEELQGLPIEFHLGAHDGRDLAAADLLVVNPAVDKAKSDFVRQARTRGIPITSEINLFVEHCPARIIGITGSTGKSTTAAMIFDVLYAHLSSLNGSPHNVWLGGNIGESLLPELARMSTSDFVVLELSSFQLEDLASLQRSPHIAVVTNLSPIHLDRHGTFENYLHAKAQIFAHQASDDVLLLSEQAAGVLTDKQIPLGGQRQIIYGQAAELAGRLNVIGEHNQHNATAALHVGRLLGLSDSIVVEELSKFAGLPHRLEFVRTYEDARYYNDSKATTPQATATALAAFEGKVILICGGCDRPYDYELLASAIRERARAVICFGENRAKIATYIRRAPAATPLPTIKSVHEFNGGINLARRLARPGEVVLFSPAAASYDAFVNYEQRGDHFKTIVNNWI